MRSDRGKDFSLLSFFFLFLCFLLSFYLYFSPSPLLPFFFPPISTLFMLSSFIGITRNVPIPLVETTKMFYYNLRFIFYFFLYGKKMKGTWGAGSHLESVNKYCGLLGLWWLLMQEMSLLHQGYYEKTSIQAGFYSNFHH